MTVFRLARAISFDRVRSRSGDLPSVIRGRVDAGAGLASYNLQANTHELGNPLLGFGSHRDSRGSRRSGRLFREQNTLEELPSLTYGIPREIIGGESESASVMR